MIAGMMKSQNWGRSATLTQAPALFAAAQVSSDNRSSSIATKQTTAALEIRGLRIARHVMKVRLIEELAKIVCQRGRICRHARAGLDEVFRSPRGHYAATDDECRLSAKLEKNRQMAHGYPAQRSRMRASAGAGEGIKKGWCPIHEAASRRFGFRSKGLRYNAGALLD